MSVDGVWKAILYHGLVFWSSIGLDGLSCPEPEEGDGTCRVVAGQPQAPRGHELSVFQSQLLIADYGADYGIDTWGRWF
jgi:hypothetical protein